MIDTLAGVGAALSAFLLSILSVKRPYRRADAWLAVWLAAQTLFCAALLVSLTMPHRFAVAALTTGQLAVLAFGPAQYLYAATALGARRRYSVHATVMLAGGGLALALPFIAHACARDGAIRVEGVKPWLLLLSLGCQAALSLYPLAVLRLVRRRTSNLKDRLSRIEGADPSWLQVWAWSSLVVLIGWSLLSINSALMDLRTGTQVVVSLLFLIAHVAYVGLNGLTRPGVFFAAAMPAARAAPVKEPIDQAAAVQDFERVRSLLDEHKPHLNPELTAQMLADRMGWGPERLTQALREGGSLSFFDAVNGARVREVQALAADPAKARAPLLVLAHEAGFGSKTAFYEAFQRHVGCAPAAWRRRELQKRSDRPPDERPHSGILIDPDDSGPPPWDAKQ